MPLKPGAGRAPRPSDRPARTVWPFVLGIGVLAAVVVGSGAWLLVRFLASQPIQSEPSAAPVTLAIASPSAPPAAASSTAPVTSPPRPTVPATTLGAKESDPPRVAAAKPTNVPRRAPSEPTQAVRVGGQIKEPKKLTNVSPSYPEIAKQARVQGIVILECTIGPQGRVTDVKVLRGIPLLDQAAIDAVKQWVYAPTLLNGVPVAVIMTVTVNFKLS